ncbi:MAG: hypothetical protein JSS27_00715 [Planctomycetes bacterium]|nr:hypothetical protein [Planctomycetota bacterium]
MSVSTGDSNAMPADAALSAREVGLELDHLPAKSASPQPGPLDVGLELDGLAPIAAPPIEVLTAQVTAPPIEIQIAAPAAPPTVVPRATEVDSLDAAANNQASIWFRARQRWLTRRNTPLISFTTSAVVHCVTFILLGLSTTPITPLAEPVTLIARVDGPTGEPQQMAVDVTIEESTVTETSVPISADSLVAIPQRVSPAASRLVPVETNPLALVSAGELLHSVGGTNSTMAGSLAGRGPVQRAGLIDSEGGTPHSEEAVSRGLRWLQTHQNRDGSWHFNHHDCPACNGQCGQPGSSSSTTAATALALLPFLAAGHTHRTGDYQLTVEQGLYYLRGRGRQVTHGSDFQEGTMYAQGMAAICLAEALGMTGDQSLREPAERAIEFILFAQDKKGGGWRYTPGQPGDMTVTGWQLMALRCGQMNYLKVPAENVKAAVGFLDTMGEDQGATYGYLGPGREPVSTAVGLLSRMYNGWRRDHPPMARGVRYLIGQGPSKDDMYYNFYATQVMHHWGGIEWHDWNNKLREYLIQAQGRQGHETGSWHFVDAHGSSTKGGRLYNTCLAILTLEVYYRYLPIYDKTAVNDSF